MNEVFEALALEDSLRSALEWLVRHATDGWVWLQLVLLVVVMVVVYYVDRASRERTVAWLRKRATRPALARLVELVADLYRPLLLLILLWLCIGVLREITWPSRSYLLGVVASLMTAWIVIRLGSGFIRNPTLAKTLALFAWTIAALNIVGLLGPTIEVLDGIAFTVGELRVSILTVFKGMAVLAGLLWVASALSGLLERRIRRMPDLTPSVQVLIGKLLKITLLTFAVLIALSSVGIDLTAFTVFSGAVGVGIGFGLQRVMSNLISGVILLLDKSIKPGDVIELGETYGWISSLGARYVSVVTRDGKEYLIPNEDLITQRVINWSYSDDLVRLEISFGVSYRSDPHAVRRIACEAALKPERVTNARPPVCHVVGFGDSSIDFVLRFWIRDPSQGVVNVRGEVFLALWDAFKAHGIEIPYPHRQLLLPDPVRVARVDEPRPDTA